MMFALGCVVGLIIGIVLMAAFYHLMGDREDDNP